MKRALNAISILLFISSFAVVCVGIIALPSVGYSQLSSAYTTIKKTVTETVDKAPSVKNCPVYAYTPRGKILRSPWELEPQWNVIDIPANGRVQGRTENFGVQLNHNLSASFGVYARYGIRSTEKNTVDGAAYEEEWETQEALGGVHLYITPVIKIFGGAGKIWAKNEEGEPELETAFERGLSFDVPLSDYKLVITYKIMEAQLAEEDPDVSEIVADGSYQSIGISLSIPLNYGEGVKD